MRGEGIDSRSVGLASVLAMLVACGTTGTSVQDAAITRAPDGAMCVNSAPARGDGGALYITNPAEVISNSYATEVLDGNLCVNATDQADCSAFWTSLKASADQCWATPTPCPPCTVPYVLALVQSMCASPYVTVLPASSGPMCQYDLCDGFSGTIPHGCVDAGVPTD